MAPASAKPAATTVPCCRWWLLASASTSHPQLQACHPTPPPQRLPPPPRPSRRTSSPLIPPPGPGSRSTTQVRGGTRDCGREGGRIGILAFAWLWQRTVKVPREARPASTKSGQRTVWPCGPAPGVPLAAATPSLPRARCLCLCHMRCVHASAGRTSPTGGCVRMHEGGHPIRGGAPVPGAHLSNSRPGMSCPSV